MKVKTITDDQNGKRWDIYKKVENQYYYKYYEFFKSIGWRLTGKGSDGYMSKDLIEWDFEITVI